MNYQYDFSGKVIVITGSSRGIGLEVAKAFYELGGKIVITSRKEEAFKELKTVFPESDRVLFLPLHTGKLESINSFVKIVLEKWGNVDVLVNNAATNPYFGPMIYANEKAWDKIMDVNLKGYFFMSQTLSQHWMQNNLPGNVINITSIAGLKSTPGLGVYGISKAGVIQITKNFAKELGSVGIRFNAIAPGLVKTKFSQALWSSEEMKQEWLKNQAIQDVAGPEDIVGVILFLASDNSKYITGETIVIDGGGLA